MSGNNELRVTDVKSLGMSKSKGIVRIVITLLIVMVLAFAAMQVIPPRQTTNAAKNPFLAKKNANGKKRPLVVAHAGAEELFPSNTRIAFDSSYQTGVDMFETDTHLTSDGVLICQHDDTIDRLTDGTGYVRDYTFSELQKFNFAYHFQDASSEYTYRGEMIPPCTIEELFVSYPDMLYSIDLKAEGNEGYKAADALYLLIKKYNMQEKVIVASFHNDVLNYFKGISKDEIITSTGYNETKKFVLMTMFFADLFYNGSDEALQVPVSEAGISLATKRIVNSAHKRGMGVQYWTINDKEEMRRLIKIGADGIITDRPDVLMELLDEMGY